MSKQYDCIIIGAGPSGLFAAIELSRNGKRVLILEKNNYAGRKLLMTGAGRCNLTHIEELDSFATHYGKKERFVKSALFAFTPQHLIQWFNQNGLETVVCKNDKVFPVSDSAKQVRDLLVYLFETNSGEIYYKSQVYNISYSQNSFSVKTQSDEYSSYNLIIAVGGASYPSTGSSGDGYDFARSLGHKIIEPTPALCAVYVQDYPYKDFSGISFKDATIAIWRDKKLVHRKMGDILCTEQGFSGPAILDSTRYIRLGDKIEINMTPFNSVMECSTDFNDKCNEHGKKSIRNVIGICGIPDRIAEFICVRADVECNRKAAEIGKVARKKIVEFMCSDIFSIIDIASFKDAMVTAGGVSIDEIDRKTMESRIIPKLYFVGEVLDVDGDTGGYNLQFAFSSGYVAAKSILASPARLV